MHKRFIMVLAGLSLLTACGGTGGSDSSTANLPAVYTGITSQATVTTSNAKAVSLSAYSGSQMASSFDVLGKAATDSNDQSPLLQEVAGILEINVSTIVQESKTSAKIVEATSTSQNTINGYNGSFKYTINVDTTSGSFSGTLTYLQYMSTSSSISMTGNVTFSGVINQATSIFTSFNMTMTGVTISSGSTSISMTGAFANSISGSTKTYTTTMAITDNVSNGTTLLKDYTLQLIGNSLTITGTYYDPTYGYVVISTATPLTVSYLSATPTSGRLICTGSNGTKARLTFVSGGYTVETDNAGNGSYVVVP
jgi:hypothetical protein